MANGRNSSEQFRVFDLDTGTETEFVQGVSLRTGASGGSVPAGTVANPLVVTGGGEGLQVRDDYLAGEILPDQTGAGAVLTFTFTASVQLLVVHGNGLLATDIARADPFGGIPSATLGIPIGDEAPMFITVTTSSVKVFAPTGMVITVWGFRR